MESGKVFEKQKLPVGAHRIFSADGFSLRVSREKEGWMINHTERSVNQGEPYDFTGGEYFQTGKSATLIVLPALPAKPLVFKGNSIHVVPGQKFSFYLKIPLSVQLYYAKNLPSNLMKEMPARRLSDTWFGDAMVVSLRLHWGMSFTGIRMRLNLLYLKHYVRLLFIIIHRAY